MQQKKTSAFAPHWPSPTGATGSASLAGAANRGPHSNTGSTAEGYVMIETINLPRFSELTNPQLPGVTGRHSDRTVDVDNEAIVARFVLHTERVSGFN